MRQLGDSFSVVMAGELGLADKDALPVFIGFST